VGAGKTENPAICDSLVKKFLTGMRGNAVFDGEKIGRTQGSPLREDFSVFRLY
jgi:hypothetical protein